MSKVPMDRIRNFYRTHRRENFAVGQRPEGIATAVTVRGHKAPLPTKD